MSINVTVHGNPVSIRRKKILLADPNDLKKNEFDRRRKLRLQQVRQQSKDISNRLLNKVKNEKDKQRSLFEEEQISEMKKKQAMRLLSLQQKYQDCLEDVGTGHKMAAAEPDHDAYLIWQRERDLEQAYMRGREAVEQARREEERARFGRVSRADQQKANRTVEDLRSAMISSIGKRQPKSTKRLKTNKPLHEIDRNATVLDENETALKTLRPSKFKPAEKVAKKPKKIPPLYGINNDDDFEDENSQGVHVDINRDRYSDALQEKSSSTAKKKFRNVPPLIGIGESLVSVNDVNTKSQESVIKTIGLGLPTEKGIRETTHVPIAFHVPFNRQTEKVEDDAFLTLPQVKITKHTSETDSRFPMQPSLNLTTSSSSSSEISSTTSQTSEGGVVPLTTNQSSFSRSTEDDSKSAEANDSTSSAGLPRPGPPQSVLSTRHTPSSLTVETGSSRLLPSQSGQSETYRTQVATPFIETESYHTQLIASSMRSGSSTYRSQPVSSCMKSGTSRTLTAVPYEKTETSLKQPVVTSATQPRPRDKHPATSVRQTQPDISKTQPPPPLAQTRISFTCNSIRSRSPQPPQPTPQPLRPMTPDEASDSDCFCSEVSRKKNVHPTHPNTQTTLSARPALPARPTSGRVAHPPQPTAKVQYYDHSARYHREYQAEPTVERVSARQMDAASAAQCEREREAAAPVQWVQTTSGRMAQRARRGNKALERERIHRDYRKLLDELGHLSREERLLRSTQIPGPPLDLHQPDERRKARLAVRQRNMDSAFEKVFHSTRHPDDISTTGTTLVDSRRPSVPTTHHSPQEAPTKLNVAQFRQYVAPPLPTQLPPPPDISSSCDSETSIVVGYLPEGTQINAGVAPVVPETLTTLESLLDRVNVQRTLLLQEVSRDLQALEANCEHSCLNAQKRPADRDISFSSDSNSDRETARAARVQDNKDMGGPHTIDRHVVWERTSPTVRGMPPTGTLNRTTVGSQPFRGAESIRPFVQDTVSYRTVERNFASVEEPFQGEQRTHTSEPFRGAEWAHTSEPFRGAEWTHTSEPFRGVQRVHPIAQDTVGYRTTERNVAWLQAPFQGMQRTHTLEVTTSSGTFERNELRTQLNSEDINRRHMPNNNIDIIYPVDKNVHKAQVYADNVAKTLTPDKGIEKVSATDGEQIQGKQTQERRNSVAFQDDGSKMKEQVPKSKQASNGKQGVGGEENLREKDVLKEHKERKASKKGRSHKKKCQRVTEAVPMDSDVRMNSNTVENSCTTIISEYSVDMVRSKMEQNSRGFLNVANNSLGSSSSSSYEGVKVTISVMEKSQRTIQNPKKNSSITQDKLVAPSIEDLCLTDGPSTGGTKSNSKPSSRERKEKSKHEPTLKKKVSRDSQESSKRILPECDVDSGNVPLKTSQSRSTESIKSIPKKTSRDGEQKTSHPDIFSHGNKRPNVKEKNLEWRQKFKRKGNVTSASEPSTSTSYNSPPEELPVSQSEIVNTLLLTINKQQEKLDKWKSNLQERLNAIVDNSTPDSDHPVNPKLAYYIERLLNMGKVRIEDLRVEVSDVCSPSSSIINDPHNEDGPDALDSLLQERIKQIAKELGDIEEHTSEESDSAFVRAMVKEVREQAKANAKRKIAKEKSKKSSHVRAGTTPSKTSQSYRIPVGLPPRLQTTDSSVTLDSAILYEAAHKSLHHMNLHQFPSESSAVETTQDTSTASVIYTQQRRKFRVPSPIPHEEPTPYTQTQPKQSFSGEHQKAVERTRPASSPGKENHEQLDESFSRKSPENDEWYEGVQKQCSERINGLSQMIDRVRIEKQQILEHSPRSTAKTDSPRSDSSETTRYKSPPPDVLVPQDVAPPLRHSLQHVNRLSPPYANLGSHVADREQESYPHMISVQPDSARGTSYDTVSSSSLIARSVFLTEPNDVRSQQLPEHSKPPPSLWRNILRNEVPRTAAHELSDILEVDQQSREASNSRVLNVSPSSETNLLETSDNAMPDVMAEMLRRRLISSPLQYSLSPDDSAASDGSHNSQSFYRSMLETGSPGPATHAAPVSTSPAPPSVEPWRGESPQEDSPHDNSSNDQDSVPGGDLDKTFKRLGLGWAGATLRKTQETKDLSSSSSDLGRVPSKSMGRGSAGTSGTQSTPVRASSVDYTTRLPTLTHSTPIKSATDSSNSVENNETSESSIRSQSTSSHPTTPTNSPMTRSNVEQDDKKDGNKPPK